MLALFSDKQDGQNSTKLVSKLLSNPVEREHLMLELLGKHCKSGFEPIHRTITVAKGMCTLAKPIPLSISNDKDWLM